MVLRSYVGHTRVLSQLLHLVVIIISLICLVLQILFRSIMAQQLWAAILLLLFQTRIVLIYILAIFFRSLLLHILFLQILCLNRLLIFLLIGILELILSILVSIIQLLANRCVLALVYRFFHLMTAHADLAIVALSQGLTVSFGGPLLTLEA